MAMSEQLALCTPMWFTFKMTYLEKIRTFAQKTPMGLESWLISFTAIVMVRIFLEQYSSFMPNRFVLIDLPTIVHYYVFYLAATVSFMAIFLFFGKISLKETSAIFIFSLFIVWTPPIVDILTAGVGKNLITYLFVPGKELVFRFFTFFHGHFSLGITLGIQIEIALILFFSFLYLKTAANAKKAGLAVFAMYFFLFFFLGVPSLIALFSTEPNIIEFFKNSIFSSHILNVNTSPQFYGSNMALIDLGFNKIMTGIFIIITFMATAILFFQSHKEKFIAVIKNSRIERILHYLLLIVFGLVLSQVKIINWVDILILILTFISFASAWIFSVCQNDIYDQSIDSISNPKRPLISKKLSVQEINFASKIFLVFAFLTAYAAGNYTLFFVLVFILIYYIYSIPPLRLKRLSIFNSFLVSIACLSAILSGFFLLNPEKNITSFPLSLILGIIILFTITTNIRDIKDIEGDRASNIKTLPTLLGEKKAKILLAILIDIFTLAIPWYFNIPILIFPAVITAILLWYFITSNNYKEWRFFAVYLTYFSLIITSLIFKL